MNNELYTANCTTLHFSTFRLQFQGGRVLINGFKLGSESVAVPLVKTVYNLFVYSFKCNLEEQFAILLNIFSLVIISVLYDFLSEKMIFEISEISDPANWFTFRNLFHENIFLNHRLNYSSLFLIF